MAGKAQLPKTSVDRIVRDSVERKKQFGRERSLFAGIPQILAVNGVGVSHKATGGIVSQSMSLPTSGGPMIGPLAFHPVATLIADGAIDVGTEGSAFSSRVIVLGAGSSADNLCRISGSAHAGQILFLQAVSTTAITLKYYTNEGSGASLVKGNIYMPSGSDYVVDGKEIVLLQWDTINKNPAYSSDTDEYGQWTLVATSQGSGGSGADTDLSNLTATGEAHFANPQLDNLDLGNVSINADLVPSLDVNFNLGSASPAKYWENLYVKNIRFKTGTTHSGTGMVADRMIRVWIDYENDWRYLQYYV